MSHARIRKVTFKDGRAPIEILRRKVVNPDGENWRGKIVGHARRIASEAIGGDMVGYFIIGMYEDGSASTAFRRDPDRCRIPKRLWPAYIAEIVREEIVTGSAIEDALEEWEE